MGFVLRATGLILATSALLLKDFQVVLCSPTELEIIDGTVVGCPVELNHFGITNSISGQSKGDFDTTQSQSMLAPNVLQRPNQNSKPWHWNISKKIHKAFRKLRGKFRSAGDGIAHGYPMYPYPFENSNDAIPLGYPDYTFDVRKLEYSTVYRPFFQQIETISEKSQKIPLLFLAESMINIAPQRRSLKIWQNWVSFNEERIIEFYQVAKAVLATESKLSPEERLWVLGIVAALGNDLPRGCKQIEKHLASNRWGEPISLELDVARGQFNLSLVIDRVLLVERVLKQLLHFSVFGISFAEKFEGLLKSKPILLDQGT